MNTNQLNRRQFVFQSAAGLAIAAALPKLAYAQANTPIKKLRIGIAGGRFGALFYWHEHPGCIVEAVTDLIPARREHLMKTYRCAKSYPSLEEMIKDPNIDAIGVFTEAPNHFKHVMLALDNGKHVISAVPVVMAHTVEEGLDQAHQLYEKVKQTGLTYMMAETSYYQQQTISVRKLYNDGAFGRITYCESDYFHPGLRKLYGTAESPTWRYGVPPMFYAMHNTMHLIGITGERLTSVSCAGWGDDDPICQENAYGNNPFWNENANFISNTGTPFRVRIWWEAPVWDTVSASWYGTKMTVTRDGEKWVPSTAKGQDDAGYETAKAEHSKINDPAWWKTDMLPVSLRHPSQHEGSHTFLTHEFVDAMNKGRRPSLDIHEAIAWTVPGIIAHQSALKGGELLKIPQFGMNA